MFLKIPSKNMADDEKYITSDSETKVKVNTKHGDIMVAVHGERKKPAIFTYHDLGLNHTSFRAFFNYVEMRALLENFSVYNINAPGQEQGADDLSDNFHYPTMEDLSEQINTVADHFKVESFIGIGVGSGANLLTRFALNNPKKVDALAVINCVSTQVGWTEWGYQKINTHRLRSKGVTQEVMDYLMWYHLGPAEERNPDLVHIYREHFLRNVNSKNLAMFIDSYIRRTDLNISREGNTLKVPVLNVTGASSPGADETVAFNGRLNPANSTWIKISDCAMVLEEKPDQFSNIFQLFLQGEGCIGRAMKQKC